MCTRLIEMPTVMLLVSVGGQEVIVRQLQMEMLNEICYDSLLHTSQRL